MTIASLPTYSGPIIRRATPVDIEAVIELSQATPASPPWPAKIYETYCVPEGRAGDLQIKSLWVACLPRDPSQQSQPRLRKIIGFAAFACLAGCGECELENIAVAEQWKMQGIGTRLLDAGLLWCRTWLASSRLEPAGSRSGSGLRLEVRASNKGAIAFYQRTGFTITGSRPAYYAEPAEDALLMWKTFDAHAVS